MKISAVVPDKLGIALEDDRWPSGTTRVRGSPDQGIPKDRQRPNMNRTGEATSQAVQRGNST